MIERAGASAIWGVGVLALIGSLLATPGFGVWGVPDQVPAATLLVPLLETGIDITTHPPDTLPTVYNVSAGEETLWIHWHVWTRDGQPVLGGNVSLRPAATWSGSFRDITNTAPDETREALRDGSFFRGFMTVDVVTEATDQTPFSLTYPFGDANALLGATYYVRLLQGSANGLAMVPLERVNPEASSFVEGFYADNPASGLREEIDGNARDCAKLTSRGMPSCVATNPDDTIDTIRARVFRNEDSPLAIDSRLVVFAWNTLRPNAGGPSAICSLLGCATEYAWTRYDQGGDLVESRPVRLDHVVNILELEGGAGAGDVVLSNIADPDDATQIFAFVFNSAQPAGTSQNWDAIFEASIVAEP